jgi:Uncharacterized protein involved in exopolysaccharide biosynthesis
MSPNGATPAVKAAPEAPFGLDDFLRVVAKRQSLIRWIAIAVVALTVIAVYSLPTLYSTSAVVMLDQRKNTVADASSVLSALPTDPSSVQNQIQVLSSRDLAMKVIAKLHLETDPEFNPALGGGKALDLNPLHLLRPAAAPWAGDTNDGIVSAFLSRLDVSQLGVSTSIEVAFKSADPQKAARIANALAESYTNDQVSVKVGAARKASQWLSDRVHQLAGEVQQQEAAIQLYKAENDLVESAPGNSLVDQQLMAINTQLVTAQSDLAEKKAAYDRVAALSKTGNSADTTQVVNSKMIGDLRAQEGELVRQEADLAARYGPNHPKMVAIQNARRDLAAKISREVDGIAGSMQSELEVAKAHVGAIEASLSRTTREARKENVARIKLNALEANLASTRTIYENFVQRLRAVQDQDDIQIPEARVISSAPVPASPASPKRALFIGASIPAGILFGILIALILERFGMARPAEVPAIAVPARFPQIDLTAPRQPAQPAPAALQAGQMANPQPADASFAMPPFAAPAFATPAFATPAAGPAFAMPTFAGLPPAQASQKTAARQTAGPSHFVQQAAAEAGIAMPAFAAPPRPSLPPPPILAEIAASADLRLADWVLDNPASPYAKSLFSLLQSLLPGPASGARLVTLTAPAAEAGKPVAALALARIAAVSGLRTVLIDADLGRLAPAGARAGIAGVLAGLPLASVMLKDRRTPLFLMAGPVAVWPEPRTAALIAYLKQNCDLIIVDTAPPRTSGPWPALARLSDSIVLYAPAKAQPLGLDGALRSLVAMSAPVKGLVLAR